MKIGAFFGCGRIQDDSNGQPVLTEPGLTIFKVEDLTKPISIPIFILLCPDEEDSPGTAVGHIVVRAEGEDGPEDGIAPFLEVLIDVKSRAIPVAGWTEIKHTFPSSTIFTLVLSLPEHGESVEWPIRILGPDISPTFFPRQELP